MAYGSAQAWGQFRAAAAGLHHSHSNNLHHSSWQHLILNPLSEARDQTCILKDTSRIRFCCITVGRLRLIIIFFFLPMYLLSVRT